ncbi:hypothetical protein GQX74_011152 [Glossina fuscipes]|nr:hypothetical protein GQX74_011152 [Glossina fuscipes]
MKFKKNLIDRELIRILLPLFYEHLKQRSHALELLFYHRWLLLCFQRQFTEDVVIRILAIIAVYADDMLISPPDNEIGEHHVHSLKPLALREFPPNLWGEVHK